MTLHRQVSMAASCCGRAAQNGGNGMRASPASPESLCAVPSSLRALLDMASSPQPRRLGSLPSLCMGVAFAGGRPRSGSGVLSGKEAQGCGGVHRGASVFARAVFPDWPCALPLQSQDVHHPLDVA